MKNLLLATILLTAASTFAQTDWTVAKTIHIGGDGGWDYLTVDPATHLVYFALERSASGQPQLLIMKPE